MISAHNKLPITKQKQIELERFTETDASVPVISLPLLFSLTTESLGNVVAALILFLKGSTTGRIAMEVASTIYAADRRGEVTRSWLGLHIGQAGHGQRVAKFSLWGEKRTQLCQDSVFLIAEIVPAISSFFFSCTEQAHRDSFEPSTHARFLLFFFFTGGANGRLSFLLFDYLLS